MPARDATQARKIFGWLSKFCNPLSLRASCLANEAGQYVAPGLPNILGNLHQFAHGNASAATDGAFRTTYTSANGGTAGSGLSYDVTTFDASRCSVLYGNSDSVMPASINIYVIIYLGK